MLELVEAFEADYQVRHDPSRPAGDHSYDFVAPGVSGLSPAVEISVTPDDGDTWHGRFFGSYNRPNVVVNGPGPNLLVAVAAGVAYVVPVSAPSDYEVLSVWPVRKVLCPPGLKLVIFVSFTDVLALGEGGEVRWEATSLVSDGFTDVRIEGSTLVVRGYFAPENREVETILDLASGLALG